MNDISDGQLFADYQVSVTEITLLELLDEHRSLTDTELRRLQSNRDIVVLIKLMMQSRFSQDQIESFMINGYPRATNLMDLLR